MKSWTVARNVFRRIRQDPRTVALVVLIPLLFILLYGYSFSGELQHLKVVIVNQDNGLVSVRTEELGRITLQQALAEKLLNGLNRKVLDVRLEKDPEAARAQVERGHAWAALIFPPNFSHALVNEALRLSGPRTISYAGQTLRLLPPEASESSLATLFLDDSNPPVAAAVLQVLNQALSNVLAEQQTALTPPNLLEVRSFYGGKIRVLDYTAPGVIGFAITLITIMLTAISIVRERTSGTLTRLLIAPVRPWEASLGYTLAFALIALLQAGELLLVSHLIFKIHFAGNPAWVILTIFLFTVGLQGVATLLSTVARNEFQAVQFILVILIPSIMVSGVFWPVEGMPSQVQPLAWLSPLTYANSALRGVMLRGWGLSEIALELGVLAAFALLMLLLSVQSMRRQAYSA